MTKGVLRLGGFHILMSACGSVFKMMKEYGREEALEEAHGPNAVTQTTSGKAIARTLRGLFLVDAALSTKLVTTFLPTGEVTTMTAIHESVSNEGNAQEETLSENVDEPMDTDHR